MARAASRTARGVAALRAAHRILDAEPWLLDDSIASHLLDSDLREAIRLQPERFQSPGARALRSHVLLRSRYAEDCLEEAVSSGVGQFVILGAGLDTFAYRQPAWAAKLAVFEVDHPASQADKRRQLDEAGILVPSNVTYAPIDFETEALGPALARTGFDARQPTFVSWLGVSMYLTLEAIDAVLAWAASLPQGSGLVFTFAPPDDPQSGPQSGPGLAELAAKAGEPWLTRFEPEALIHRLHAAGFAEATIPPIEETRNRYFLHRSDGLPPPRRGTLALARR